MLTATADHALRAVLFLARHSGRVTSSDEIARAIGAPRNYLSKILYELAKAGVVTSTAGRQGGFSLAVDASELPIAAITDRFEPPPVSPRCMLGDRACDPANPCAAHERWSSITRAYRTALDTTTIAELID